MAPGIMNAIDHIQVFHGEATPALARIYVRLPRRDAWTDCQLVGRVVGPRCNWAQTLPATTKLMPHDDLTWLLAEAVVPDPCFWSDELPMLYQVQVEIRRGDQLVERVERWIGLRALGPRGRSFVRQSKRWVPRGVCFESAALSNESDASLSGHDALSIDLEAWRDANAALMIKRPADALLLRADELGVWLAVETSGDAADVTRELTRLGRHAAVMMAVLPEGISVTAEHRAAAPNLLLVEQFAAGTATCPSPLANAAVVDVAECTDATDAFKIATTEVTLPIIARRRLAQYSLVKDARAACDRLQRNLSPAGDYAGYFV